jgi:hypothetical protein
LLAFTFQQLSFLFGLSIFEKEISIDNNDLVEVFDEIDESNDFEDEIEEELEDDKSSSKLIYSESPFVFEKFNFGIKSYLSNHNKTKIYSPPEVEV